MPSGRLASAVTTPALEIEPLFHQKLSPGSGSVAPITLLRVRERLLSGNSAAENLLMSSDKKSVGQDLDNLDINLHSNREGIDRQQSDLLISEIRADNPASSKNDGADDIEEMEIWKRLLSPLLIHLFLYILHKIYLVGMRNFMKIQLDQIRNI